MSFNNPMPANTSLTLNDTLPLTCSRSGTCCHGNVVMLNPWELSQLAHAKGISPKDFRDRFCEWGGIRLRFDGKKNALKKDACSQYVPNVGCGVYLGRPLVCRLFPLGRQKLREQTHYMFQGSNFPCLTDCPEVVDLPEMSVENYLKGQETELCEMAQDAYLDLMKSLVDGAFSMLIDSGLAATGDEDTLKGWSSMGHEPPEKLVQRLGSTWLDSLMTPDLEFPPTSPLAYSQAHYQYLQVRVEKAFSSSTTPVEFSQASITLMGLALHLGRSLGANPASIVEHWIKEANHAISDKL